MANVINDIVRIPATIGTAGASTVLTGGGTRPVEHVHTRNVPITRTKVDVKNIGLTITAAGAGAADAAGQAILTLPAGLHLLVAADFNFTVTTPTGLSVATAVFALGTAAATNADAALTSTEADIVASQTLGDGTLAAAAAETEDTTILGTGTAPAIIGAATATDIYLNIGGTFTHASDGDHEVSIDGTVELLTIDLGMSS